MSPQRFDTLVFAGGGNRCWWQAGLLSRWTERGISLPLHFVGTSAGAAIASAYMVNKIQEALDSCVSLYKQNDTLFRWDKLRRFEVEFAHSKIYPTWIGSFITRPSFDSLKTSKRRLTAAVTHPIRLLGPSISISIATLAYLLDRNIGHSIHPKIPRYLGLRTGFYPLHECPTVEDGRNLLCAAAAAPPIMRSVDIGGTYAFDGGYTDNAPIGPQSQSERAATLVLLTRHYPKYASTFRYGGRTYLQPTRPVPVSTWDCTAKATVMDAFALGYEDASR